MARRRFSITHPAEVNPGSRPADSLENRMLDAFSDEPKKRRVSRAVERELRLLRKTDAPRTRRHS